MEKDNIFYFLHGEYNFCQELSFFCLILDIFQKADYQYIMIF